MCSIDNVVHRSPNIAEGNYGNLYDSLAQADKVEITVYLDFMLSSSQSVPLSLKLKRSKGKLKSV